mgnify:CR=1 FL=1
MTGEAQTARIPIAKSIRPCSVLGFQSSPVVITDHYPHFRLFRDLSSHELRARVRRGIVTGDFGGVIVRGDECRPVLSF